MNQVLNIKSKMKKVLLLTPYGPDEKKWGQDMYDVLGSRLARGNGIFGMSSHLHAFALYLIAENIRNPATVLEYPLWDDFIDEIRKGYDVVCIQFKSYYAPKVAKMMKAIRKESPQTEIVIGGYGVGMLNDPIPNDPERHADYIRDNADHLCRDEGIKFMRRLLNDGPIDRPITQYHIPCGSFNIPNLYFKMRIPAFLVSVGCPNACDFCNTSAFFHHKKIYTAEPAQVYDFMKNHQRKYNDDYQVFALFDEDFFLNPEYVRELGRLIRSDKKTWGFRYFTFGSIGAISQFEPEELRENGLGAVWIGVESGLQEDGTLKQTATSTDEGKSRTGYKKRDGAKSAPEVFRGLQDHGIATVASMILGFDFHTRDNLKLDIDYFVSLQPTFYQIGVLTPCPGTKLYKKIVEEDRLMEHFGWDDIHLWKADVFKVKNFEPNELKEYYDYAHEQLYAVNGPPLVQIYEASLRAHETMKNSKSEFLRHQAESSLDLAKLLYNVSGSIANHAPSPAVRQRIKNLDASLESTMGDAGALEKFRRGVAQNIVDFMMDGASSSFSESRLTEQHARWTYYNRPGEENPVTVRSGRSALRTNTLSALEKQLTFLKFLDFNQIESSLKKSVGLPA